MIKKYIGFKKEKDNNSYIAENQDIKDITITKTIMNVSGNTLEETIEQLKNMEGGTYEELIQNDDGSITLKMTKNQREAFKVSRIKMLNELKDMVESHKKNYTITWNEDCTEAAIYYNLDLDPGKAIGYVIYEVFLCQLYQIANGVQGDECTVKIGVYNSDTGKLVKEAIAPGEKLKYEPEDWERSK